jgi:hypothetical protein
MRATPLPMQLLSNLLWAACGVNRRHGPFAVPGRTAASASNSQEIDVYVADVHRLMHTAGFEEPGLHDPEIQKAYYYVDTGLIAGNAYLFAASQGLGAWFHNCDRAGLKQRLGLREEQRVLFAQSFGYPEAG